MSTVKAISRRLLAQQGIDEKNNLDADERRKVKEAEEEANRDEWKKNRGYDVQVMNLKKGD